MEPLASGPKRYGGRFEAEYEVGHGGMGAVYRARDLQTSEPVALKVLFEREGPNAERFVQEAAVLAELSHPAIVRYVSHGVSSNGEHYLAMEWVQGRTLEDYLAGGGIGVQPTAEMAARILDALSVAHRRGVVHRDLKPANILIPDGKVAAAKLLDFGIARRLFDGRRITRAGNTLGTPMYMSPEQARGSADVDARSDMFSMGCVLFESLTGKPPFTADTPVAVLAKICLEEAPDLRAVRPDVPPAVAALVRSMLHKEQAQRPADAAALSRTFAQIAADVRRGRVTSVQVNGEGDVVITPGEQRVFAAVLVQLPRKGPKPSPASRALSGASGSSSSMLAAALTSELAPELVEGLPQEAAGATPLSLTAIGDLWRKKPAEAEAPPPVTRESPITSEQVAADLSDAAVLAVLQKALSPFGARVERFYNGSLAVTGSQAPSTVEQTVDMARAALELKRLLPSASFAVASARAEEATDLPPLGAVLERAGALLVGAPSGSIRLDALSADLLMTRFELSEPELDTGNGKPRRLLYEKGLREPPRTVVGRPVPWIGREFELTNLSMLYAEAVDEGLARAAIVTGGPGVGKSRLRNEVLDRIYDQGVRFELLSGRGEAMRAGNPWSLLGSALRAAANVSGHEDRETLRKRFAAHVGRHIADANTRRRIVAFMGEIAGVHFADDDFPLLRSARQDPRAMADQTQAAWLDWIEAELDAGPVVLVFEDAHHGDVPSFVLTDHALRVFHDKPLVVMAFGRPELEEKFPGLWSQRDAQRVQVAPLGAKVARRLVEGIWPEVPPAHADLIVERTAGNPFFIEELVRVSLERGPEAVADTPMSILAVIQDRLDGLGEHAKRVLRAASVFGLTCRRAGVAVLLGETNLKDLDAWLEMLAEREILFRRSTGAAREYVFRQALVREASYATILDRDRVAAHAAAGAWLERTGGENAAEIAEHFVLGNKVLRAGHWFRVAAERSLAANDLDLGLGFCARAVECGVEGEELGLVRLAEARMRFWKGDAVAAQKAAEEAVALLEGVPQMEALGELVNAYGHMANDQGRTEAADLFRTNFARLFDHRVKATNWEAWVTTSLRSGTYYYASTVFGSDDRLEALARSIVDNDGAEESSAIAASLLAHVETTRGNYGAAVDYAAKAAVLFRSLGNVREALLNELNCAAAHESAGAPAVARRMLEPGWHEAARMGLHLAMFFGLNLAKTLVEVGQAKQALERVGELLSGPEAAGMPRARAYLHMTAARSHLLLKQFKASREEAQQALAIDAEAPAAVAAKALALLRLGQRHECLEVAQELEALLRVRASDVSLDALFSWLALAEIAHATGDTDGVQQALSEGERCRRAHVVGGSAVLHDDLERMTESMRAI